MNTAEKAFLQLRSLHARRVFGCLLGTLLTFGSLGCSLVANKAEITASANFDPSHPTGWTNESGVPISFSVTTVLANVQSLQCRSALKTMISSATFVDCTSGVYAPTATSGRTNGIKNDNGTYTLEVRGLSIDGSVVSSTSSDFYVHPSLNSVPTCTHTYTDEQYFAAAASYLSMTTPFGAQTNLAAPFYTIEFSRTTGHVNDAKPKREVRKFASLRKKLTVNGNNTLMLLKHTRNRFNSNSNVNPTEGLGSARYTIGECRLAVSPFAQGSGRGQYERVSDGMGGYLVNEVNEFTSYATPYGRVNYSDGPHTQYTDPSKYNMIISKGHRVRTNYRTSHSSLAGVRAWDNYFTENSITSNLSNDKFQCEAVVFNAKGKGVCFRLATLSNPVPLRAVAPLMSNLNVLDPGDPNIWSNRIYFLRSGSSNAMSNKKLINDGSNTYWNAFIAAYPTEALEYADIRVETLNP